ncbi:MAG: RNA polymerase sigma factor RpoD/SigA [Endomicrobiaceae bacterium]
MTDLLQSYFTELRHVKSATKEEMKKLWAKAKKGDKQAIERLVELNYCLVIPIAKRFSKKGVDFMDLVADGNIGLIRAVEKFDVTKNIKFSTYATYWIEQYIRKSIEDNSKTIRIPSYMYDIINKWKKARNFLMSKLYKEPSVSEISKIIKIPIEQAEEVSKTIFSLDNIVSLDVPITEDSDSCKKETITDTIVKTPESITEIIRNSQNVQKAINLLPEREAEIIRMRFGIDNTPTFSLDEIGKKMDLSRERVRQIELKAFQRLKGIFLRMKFADNKDINKLVLDQRGTKPDRRAKSVKVDDDKRKQKDRRKTWM